MPEFVSLDQALVRLQTEWHGLLSDWGPYRKFDSGPITYSIPATAPPTTLGLPLENAGFVWPLDEARMRSANEAFSLWNDLIDRDLVPVADDGADITLAFSTSTSGGGSYTQSFLPDDDFLKYLVLEADDSDLDLAVLVLSPVTWLAYKALKALGAVDKPYPDGWYIDKSHVWLNDGWAEFQPSALAPSTGKPLSYENSGFTAMVHEIGHALGLSHPGPYNATDDVKPSFAASAVMAQDQVKYTLMSYFGGNVAGAGWNTNNLNGLQPATPMLYDIAAIQQKYGASTTTRTDDTRYGYNSSATSKTGALLDVYDFTKNPTPVLTIWDSGGRDTLDTSLYAGGKQVIDLAEGAFSSVLGLTENIAIAFDTIIEDAVGGSGGDTLRGNAVANRLVGGAGADSLAGLSGNDTLIGAGGNDTLDGGDNNDWLEGGAGEDRLIGGRGQDTLLGDDGTSPPPGTASRDWLDGGDGDDSLLGGWGNDTLLGGAGQDTLDGGAGDDQLEGGASRDLLIGGTGHDTLIGGQGDDTLYGDYFGAPGHPVSGGGSLFLFRSGDGNDVIGDFFLGDAVIDQDLIDLTEARGIYCFDDVLAQCSDVPGGIKLTLNPRDSITLLGLTRDDLRPGLFRFGEAPEEGGDFAPRSATDTPTHLAALTNGGFVATWTAVDYRIFYPTDVPVYARLFNADGSAGAEFRVSVAPGIATDVKAVGLNNGNLLLWYSMLKPDSTGGDVRGRIYAPDGTSLGDEFSLGPANDVTAYGSGGFVTAYGQAFYDEQTFAQGSRILIRQYGADGAPLGPATIAADPMAGPALGIPYFSAPQVFAEGDALRLAFIATNGQYIYSDSALAGFMTARTGSTAAALLIDPVRGAPPVSDYDIVAYGNGASAIIGTTASGAGAFGLGSTRVPALLSAGTGTADGQVVLAWTGGDPLSSDPYRLISHVTRLSDGATRDLEGWPTSFLPGHQYGSRVDGIVGLADGRVVVAWADRSATYGVYTQPRIMILDAALQGVTLPGTPDNDRLAGSGWNDLITGGAGDDTLIGRAGADTLDGGPGRDLVDYGMSLYGVVIDLSHTGPQSGMDPRAHSVGDVLRNIEAVRGSAYDDDLSGAGNITLDGQWGDDVLHAMGGHAVMIGGPGADLLFGTGDATASYVGSPAGVTVDLGTTAPQNSPGDAKGDRLVDVRNLQGSAFDDRLTGDAGSNDLEGGGGNDTLDGGPDAPGAVDSAIYQDVSYRYGVAWQSDGTLMVTDLYPSLANPTGRDLLIGIEQLVFRDMTIDAAEYRPNAAPSDILLSASAIAENTPVGTVLGQFSTIDPDAGDNFTYSLRAGGSGLFSLVGDGLVVAGALDFETTPIIYILIRSTDPRGAFLDKVFGIAITDVPGVLILGTPGPDLVDADHTPAGQPLPTLEGDTILGLEGPDTLRGLGGDDLLEGGAGADSLDGGPGRNTASYEHAPSGVTVSLALGNGQGGDAEGDALIDIENLLGSAWNDSLTGDAGDDLLDGAGGDDTLLGSAGQDTLDGGEGDDLAVMNLADEAGGITFSITGFAGAGYTFRLDAPSATTQIRNVERFLITAGAGDDMIWSTQPGDSMDGGGGTDLIHIDRSNGWAGLRYAADGDSWSLGDGSVITGFEQVEFLGGGGPDSLRGGALADTLDGGGGDNTLEGGGGDDMLLARGGSNLIDGGDGYDLAVLDDGNALGGMTFSAQFEGFGWSYRLASFASTTVIRNVERFAITTGNGDDVIRSDRPGDTIDAGGGTDLLHIDRHDSIADLRFAADGDAWTLGDGSRIGGFEQVEFTAGGGNDGLTGGALNDTLDGQGGEDTLAGSAGDDLLSGGAGDDVIDGGAGDDSIDGGEGSDVAVFSADMALCRIGERDGAVIVSGPDGVDQLSNIEMLRFGAAAAVNVADLLAGGQVEPLMLTNIGGVSRYVLPESYNGPIAWLRHQWLGSEDGEVALGTSGNDFINMLGGDDAVDGGAGDDVIDGGLGSNFLTGGAGVDIFFVDGRGAASFNTWGTITDYTPGELVTIWGYKPGVSQFVWVASDGAPGFQGATMHGDLDGNGLIDTSVTFSGKTQAELPTPIFGSVAGQDYIFFG